MKRISTRLRLIALAITLGLTVGASVGIVSSQAQRAVTPSTAADALGALSSPRLATDVMPTAVASPAEDTVRRAGIGAPQLSETRALLAGVGSARATVYVFPTSTGHACFVATNGPAECVRALNDTQPIASIVFDPDKLGAGIPVSVVGLASDNVARVTITVNDTPYAATLRRNAFYFEASDPTLSPSAVQAIRVELKDGSAHTETLAPPPAPISHTETLAPPPAPSETLAPPPGPRMHPR